jgi:hypothetical protein
MEIWLENALGVKQGEGPIITASAWNQTTRLNAAGEFSFTMPALDPRAAYVRPKYFARAWQFEAPAGWREVGYGRIENISMSMSPEGLPQLTVGGVDELGELTDRICHDMSLRREVQIHPAEVFSWDGATTYLANPRTHDHIIGDTTTATLMTGGKNIVIRSLYVFHRISFVITATGDTGHLTVSYYDVDTADWATISVTDGTGNSSNTLIQNGDMIFDPPATWGVEPGKILYELRLTVSGFLDLTEIADISIWYHDGSMTALADVLTYAPAGWSLDTANGYGAVKQRPLGANILLGNTFETFTGTIDDTTSDTFVSWTNTTVNDGAGRSVLAVTGGHTGNCVKITSNNAEHIVGYVGLSQEIAVQAGLQYTLTFWAKGDGGAEGYIRCILHDNTVGGSDQDIVFYDTVYTGTSWQEFVIPIYIPPGMATLGIAFYIKQFSVAAEAVYLDDVSLQQGGGESVYLQLRDETILEALRRIAANTSENFIRSPAGRKVLWLGPDTRDSGLRALAAEPLAGTSIPNALLLANLTELTDAASLVSRVYAYGGGMGIDRVTLANITQPIPTGYVLDKTNNYLERTAAVAVLGVIETAQQWGDILPADKSETQAQYAANALMWQAWQYLETHSATDTDRVYGDVPRFYRATVVKAERMVLPGYMLRLSYHQYREGAHAIAIERDCWITAVSQQVTDAGIHLIGLELATVPRQAENDNVLIARNLIRLRDAMAHNSAEGY